MFKFQHPSKSDCGWKQAWLKYAVLALVAYLVLPKQVAVTPGIGLESSWMFSINLALLRQAHFGTDYIFTFGPLGFLSTRILLGQSKWVFIVMDAFIVLNTVYIFHDYLKPIKDRYRLIDIALILVTAILSQHIATISVLFIILIYHTSKICNNYKQPFSLIIAAAISSILFFIKINYGIVALPLFYFALLIVLLHEGKKAIPYIISAFILNAAILLVIMYHFHVDLRGFISSGLHIISDYSDAMMIEIDYHSLYVEWYLVIMAVYLAGLLFFLKRYKFNLLRCYMPFTLLLTAFLSFKNGFIRSDSLHWTGAYLMIPMLSVVPVILAPANNLKKYFKYTQPIVLMLCFYFWNSDDNIYGDNTIKGIFRTQYVAEILKSSAQLSIYDLALPDTDKVKAIKGIVGNKSIDIFPHMVAYAYAAGFNYSPRPVCQSYQAYDLYLDSINSLKFATPNTAPDYILFANSSIDNRYPFADESITKRAILEHYEVVDTFNLNSFVVQGNQDLAILFKRRENPVRLDIYNTSNEAGQMNEWIEVDSSNRLQYLYAYIEYSLAGSMKRILEQPPRLKMSVKYEDGSAEDFSAIVPIIKTGVLINKQVKNTRDSYTFFSSNGASSKKVRFVKFFTDNQGMFNPHFRIGLKSYTISHSYNP